MVGSNLPRMDALRIVNIIMVLLLVLGLVFTLLGVLPTPAGRRWPYLFSYGITMLVIGFVMLVILLIVGGASVA